MSLRKRENSKLRESEYKKRMLRGSKKKRKLKCLRRSKENRTVRKRIKEAGKREKSLLQFKKYIMIWTLMRAKMQGLCLSLI
jgi:hypothetical protein